MTDRPNDSPPRRGRRFLFALLVVVPLMGLAFGAGCLYRPEVLSLLRPKVFTATAQLHVARHPPMILDMPPFRVRESDSEFAIVQQRQLAFVKSRIVLNIALRNPKVQGLALLRDQPDPMGWLENEIKVDFHAGPEILSISLSGQDPEQLTLLVDAIAQAYLIESVDKAAQRHQQTIILLRELAGRYDKKLKNIRLSMRKLREQVGTGNHPSIILRQKMATEEAAQVQNELLTVRSELRHKSVEMDDLESNEKAPATPRELPGKAIDEDAVIQRGMEEVARLEAELADRKSLTKDAEKDPSYQKVQVALDAAKRSLTTRRESMGKRLREKADADRQARIQGTRERAVYLGKLERVLTKDLERLSKESKLLTVQTLDLEDFEDEIKRAQEMCEILTKRVELLSVEEEAPRRIRKMDETATVTGPH